MKNLFVILNIPAFWLAIATISFVAGRLRVYQLQNQGEAAVRRAITSALGSPEYHLLNNVTVPTRDGTTQIDHVLVSRYGVFVIETKHYAGSIYANPTAATWTQAFVKTKFKFQNPIFQNFKHIKAVQSLLPFVPADAVLSVVVFTGKAEFKTPRPDGVFLLRGLVAHLNSFNAEVLTRDRIESCVGRLECQRLALTRKTDIEHRMHLQRKFGN